MTDLHVGYGYNLTSMLGLWVLLLDFLPVLCKSSVRQGQTETLSLCMTSAEKSYSSTSTAFYCSKQIQEKKN